MKDHNITVFFLRFYFFLNKYSQSDNSKKKHWTLNAQTE